MAKKKRTTKAKFRFYSILSLAITVLPLLIVIGINYKNYFTTYTGLKIYIGGFSALGLAVIATLTKLKLKRIVWLLVIFGTAFFFQSLLRDATLLTGALLFGGTIDELFIVRKVKRLERIMLEEEKAEVHKETNKVLVEGIAEIIRGGRV